MFQCTAVRRTASHEQFEEENKEQDELLSELVQDAGFIDKDIDKDIEESNLPTYTKEVKCDENQFNKVTNKIAKGMYQYQDESDYTYGGYSDYPIN